MRGPLCQRETNTVINIDAGGGEKKEKRLNREGFLSLRAPPESFSSLSSLFFPPLLDYFIPFYLLLEQLVPGPLICFDERPKMTGEERKEMIGETIYIDGAKRSSDLWPCCGVPTGFSPSRT